MPSVNAWRIAAVSPGLAKAWYSWNTFDPSASFAWPGSRESVTIEYTSLRSCSRGANNGMTLS